MLDLDYQNADCIQISMPPFLFGTLGLHEGSEERAMCGARVRELHFDFIS